MSQHSIVRQAYLKQKQELTRSVPAEVSQKFTDIKAFFHHSKTLDKKQAKIVEKQESTHFNFAHWASTVMLPVLYLTIRAYVAPVVLANLLITHGAWEKRLRKIYQDPMRKPFTAAWQIIVGVIGGIIGYKAGFGMAAWGVSYIAPVGMVMGILYLLAAANTSGKDRYEMAFAALLHLIPFGLMLSIPSIAPLVAAGVAAAAMSGIATAFFAQFPLSLWNQLIYGHHNSTHDLPSHKLVSDFLQTSTFKNSPEQLGQALAILRFSEASFSVDGLSSSAPASSPLHGMSRSISFSAQELIRNTGLETEFIMPALKIAIA